MEVVLQNQSGTFFEIYLVLHASQEPDGLLENALGVLGGAVEVFVLHDELYEVTNSKELFGYSVFLFYAFIVDTGGRV
jgi:hypothetical protein